MKRALLLSLLTLAACSRTAAPTEAASVAPAGRSSAEVETAPRMVASTAAIVAPPPKPRAQEVRETDAPAPSDLHLRVDKRGAGFRLVGERRGDVLSLRQGAERATGKDRVALDLGAAATPIVLEATGEKSLETTRVVVHLTEGGGGAAPAFVAHLAETPIAAGGDQRDAHTCRAHEDGLGGFAVVCRVTSEANAGSITGDDGKDGVFEAITSTGASATTLARFDLELGDERAVSKALAYNSRGRGVLVRAEASRLPGEDRPSLVVASNSREQPMVMRHCRIGCRIPHFDPAF